jgi:outer membrane protein OmpA-like peptidoglycan-associated protein
MKNYIWIFFLILFYPVISQTQSLIKNPGFESYKKLPSGTSQWDRVEDWFNPQVYTDNPGTPDYYHLESKGKDSKLPSPAWVSGISVYPKEGNAVAGIIGCSNNDLHEYISVPLTRKTAVGERIKISFYYTNGSGTSVGSKMTRLGTYFSVEKPNAMHSRINAIPQTEMQKPMFSKEWALYEAEFVATQEYEYMTIGGFRAPSGEDLQATSNPALFNDWAYYFIDGVSVAPAENSGTQKPENQSAGIKFVFKAGDTQKPLKVKGEVLLNNESSKQSFEDSVLLLKQQTFTKITLIASVPGYFPCNEIFEGKGIPSPNSIYVINLKPLSKGTTIVLKNILFDAGSPVLLSESYTELNKLIEILKANPEMEILISGHTDNRGNAESDLKLSQQRAVNVMNYLIKNGIKANRITAKGYGMTRPIADNNTEEGRAKNRRVEFSIVK